MKPITVSHIVATSENHVIGVAGGMPWHISEDFKFFKRTTMGHGLIMGRKTFESIGRPLPGRLNIVITRNTEYKAEGVSVFESVESAVSYLSDHRSQWGDEVFIGGGGEIYRQTLPLADRVYLTRIHRQVEGDTFYPDLGAEPFQVVAEERHESPEPFTFFTFERQSK